MRIEMDVSGINGEKMLNLRGLGKNQKAWKYAATRFRHYCDAYVPMETGTLKNTAVIQTSSSGATVTWTQPYAHYQYYGKTMGPNVLTSRGWRSMAPTGGKYYTGDELTYHGSQRGKEWDKRAMADHMNDLLQDIKAYIGD